MKDSYFTSSYPGVPLILQIHNKFQQMDQFSYLKYMYQKQVSNASNSSLKRGTNSSHRSKLVMSNSYVTLQMHMLPVIASLR